MSDAWIQAASFPEAWYMAGAEGMDQKAENRLAPNQPATQSDLVGAVYLAISRLA